MRTDLALKAPEQALWARGDIDGLVHHSDRGSQYLSIRYNERLAETVIGLYKTDVIRRRGPWRNLDAVELEMSYYRSLPTQAMVA